MGKLTNSWPDLQYLKKLGCCRPLSLVRTTQKHRLQEEQAKTPLLQLPKAEAYSGIQLMDIANRRNPQQAETSTIVTIVTRMQFQKRNENSLLSRLHQPRTQDDLDAHIFSLKLRVTHLIQSPVSSCGTIPDPSLLELCEFDPVRVCFVFDPVPFQKPTEIASPARDLSCGGTVALSIHIPTSPQGTSPRITLLQGTEKRTASDHLGHANHKRVPASSKVTL